MNRDFKAAIISFLVCYIFSASVLLIYSQFYIRPQREITLKDRFARIKKIGTFILGEPETYEIDFSKKALEKDLKGWKRARKKKKKIEKLKPGETIDINTATINDFAKLKGISLKRAKDIYTFRLEINGFASIDELTLVKGIGKRKLESLKPYLTISNPRKTPLKLPGTEELNIPEEIKIDINTADVEEFTEIPGVSKRLAEKIVRLRTDMEGFKSFEDLLNVYGITRKKLARIMPFIKLTHPSSGKHFKPEPSHFNKPSSKNETKNQAKIKKEKASNKKISPENNKININSASIEELIKLKGIGKGMAKRIIEYRKKQKFNSIEDIMNVRGIGRKKFEKLKKFIKVK